MRHLTLGRMDQFSCIGSECPYTCCAGGWNITIDEKSNQYYQAAEGEYGEFLRKNIITQNGQPVMRLYNGRCAQLTEEGLCRVYMELGKDKLCDTCKYYPRLQYAAGDMLFHFFTMSCPEVGRKALSQKEPLNIHMSEEAGRMIKTPEDVNWPAFHLEFQAMLSGVDILQDRRYDIRQRQRVFLIMNRAIQDALDAKDTKKAQNLAQFFSSPENYDSIAARDATARDMSGKVRMLRELSETILKSKPDARVSSVFLNAVGYISRKSKTEAQSGTESEPQSVDRPFPEAEEALNFWDSRDGQREQEHILIYSLFRRYLIAQNHDLYHRAVFVIMFNQIQRVFLAFYSAWQGKLVTMRDRVLFLSFLSRYFEHASDQFIDKFLTALRKNGSDDLGYLFQIIS